MLLPLVRSPDADRRVGWLVAQFALAGLMALVIVAVIGAVAIHRLSITDAERDATRLTRALAVGIVQPAISDRLVAGDRRALRRLDRLVRARILHGPVVRVKLWTADGRIVYSDRRSLIGAHFALEGEEREALEDGRPRAELSDLRRPEHRFERADRRLLEVYVPIRTSTGRRLLYEDYVRFEAVAASARRTLAKLAPALAAVLLGVWLAQLPLAMTLARRLRRDQRDREELLMRAIAASDIERGRLAASLHDGPVQDLAGVTFSLSATVRDLDQINRDSLRGTLSQAAAVTRETMRQLRSLLVALHPPALDAAGLAPVLEDLAAPLRVKGIEVTVDIAGNVNPGAAALKLCFRTAREALRNVAEHADATHVALDVGQTNGRLTLTIRDDGRGVSSHQIAHRRQHGHLGLLLLEESAAEIGGRLTVESAPGGGTVVRLDVPTER
jgi:two-component system NarL family sensor kinase